MRRNPGASPLASPISSTAIALTTVLLVTALAVPWATGAPRPTIPDLMVVGGFGVGAAWLAVLHHVKVATLLAGAAVAWTATGLATSLPAGAADPVARLVLVPHAFAVVALATGRPRRAALAAVVAGAAAVAAGSGVNVPVLALLGMAVLVSLQRGLAPRIKAATCAIGMAMIALDPHVVGTALDPADLSFAVDVLLLAIIAVGVCRLAADPLRRFDTCATEGGHYDVGMWLGAVLSEPRLVVVFPSARGAIDAAGHPATYRDQGGEMRDEQEVVAHVSPAIDVQSPVREPLLAILRRLGEVARLRAECRDQALEIVASRGRFQAAADEESRRLERQLDGTLMARLDRIEALLRASSEAGIADRVEDVRAELRRHARGLDPLAGRSLGEALAAYRTRGVEVNVGELGYIDQASARTAWYVAREGITNAVKHASGADVRLEVVREARTLRVVVSDRGPGGADSGGAGLQGLADRVAAAGGALHVVSAPGGTSLCCTLPTTGFPAAPSRGIADPTPLGRS